MAKLVWEERGEVAVADVRELDAMLDRLSREAGDREPFIVELVSDDGATLSMGLGRALSVVTYVPASMDPPYMQSVGQETNSEALVFNYRGEWSEFSPGSGVPVKCAREALRHFFETQSLPDNIDWEET